MELSEYQKKSLETVNYPHVGGNFVYPALGLAGESGEMLNQVKKILRDDNNIITSDRRERIGNEMGDLLWYMAQLATELGLDLDTVAEENLVKTKQLHGHEKK